LDAERFWSIIEAGGREDQEDPERQLEAIGQALAGVSADELIEFHRLFNRALDHAYTWDLWGAAYLINGGCSDDGFAYFRSWLISRGRAAYEGALRDPDSLADLVDPDRDDYELEDLWGLALVVYEERTGEEPPEIAGSGRTEPSGQRWDFDDEEQVSRRLPKLAALYRG
jgi:hypothetical protein